MASSTKAACLLLFQIIVGLNLTKAAPQLSVTPVQIDLGLTSSLDLNCSFTLKNTSNMAGLISLVVSRGNGSVHSFEDLAAISQYTGQKITQLTTENILAKGLIDTGKQSYLHLRWSYPDAPQSGVYVCSAQGFDPSGRVLIVTSETVQVTANQPNINDYKEKVKEMSVDLEALENRVSDLEGKLNNRDQNLEQRVSALEQQQLLEKFEDPLTYQDRKYYVSKEPYSSVNVSLATCKLYGGWLAEIDDRAEHEAIQAFLRGARGYTDVVVAGSDKDSEGNWVLPSTGQTAAYLDWYSGQPNGGLSENCLVLCYPPAWKMCDLPCSYSSPPASIRYICEVPTQS